jgi:programmed cell death protein 5
MDDIEDIRRRKMREMQKRLKEREIKQSQEEQERRELETLLGQVLKPEASQYLEKLRGESPGVARRIEQIIIALVLRRRINYKIDKVIVKAIERKVKGVEPKITFMRKGKRMEISEKLREED